MFVTVSAMLDQGLFHAQMGEVRLSPTADARQPVESPGTFDCEVAILDEGFGTNHTIRDHNTLQGQTLDLRLLG